MDNGCDLIKSSDFVVQCKTPLNKFLNEHISVDKLPLITSNKLPSAEAMSVVLPQPQPSDDNPKSSIMAPSSTAKPTQQPVMDNDVYIHLVSEVKEYWLAINRMGEDILGLRSENNWLREEVIQLQEITVTSENTRVVETTGPEACSKLELIHKLSELYQRYTTLSATNSSNKQEVQSLRNICIQKNDLEKEYIELQNAHTAQQKLIQKLQGKVENIDIGYKQSRTEKQ